MPEGTVARCRVAVAHAVACVSEALPGAMQRIPAGRVALLVAAVFAQAGAVLRGGRAGLSIRADRPTDWRQHGRDWSERGQCGNRDAASPINFDDLTRPLQLNKQIGFNYLPITHNFMLNNDGYSISGNLRPDTDDGPLDIGGIQYDTGYHELIKVDFHSGSEHTFEGRHLPLEIQFTHAKKDSPSRIIVSILVDCPGELKPLDPPEEGEEGAASLLSVKSRRHRRGLARRKSAQAPPNGPVQKGYNFDEPQDPNMPALYSETGLTDEDVNGMAYEVIGHPKPPIDVEREDDFEINYVDALDMGSNWTGTHPEYLQPPQGALRRPKASAAAKVSAAPAVNFGLAATSSRKRQEPADADADADAEGDDEPEVVVYDPPSESDPDFNKLLQFFELDALPLFQESTQVNNSAEDPMYLNDFFTGMSFFEYAGTATLPPCEPATWLVRREVLKVSTRQAEEFFRTLHLMSEQAGNYRTLMPTNGRVKHVREAVQSSALPPRFAVAAARDDAARVFKARRAGEDAVKISETAQNYARDLDQRLKRSAVAHVLALVPTPVPDAPPPPPPPGITYSKKWLDPELVKRAMGTVADSHVKAVVWKSSLEGAQGTWNASYDAANHTGDAWIDRTFNTPAPDTFMASAPAAAPAGAPGAAALQPLASGLDLEGTL